MQKLNVKNVPIPSGRCVKSKSEYDFYWEALLHAKEALEFPDVKGIVAKRNMAMALYARARKIGRKVQTQNVNNETGVLVLWLRP